MAEQLLFTYTVIKNAERGGTYPHLQVGGQFATYLDDVANDYVVRDLSDNSELTLGDFPVIFVANANTKDPANQEIVVGNATDVGTFASDYISNYQFCDGTTLQQFTQPSFVAFPFATSKRTDNDASCQGGVSCDLVITDVSVTNESGTGSADGSITVTATTSQPNIQYNLSPFNYGSGQSSSTFSGLISGEYTVYAKDDAQCSAQITVNVLNQAAEQYNTIYRVRYKDINGNDARFDIQKYEYGGSITEVTSGSQPVVYVQNELDQFDVFGVARPSYINVTLHELSKFEYIDLITTTSNREYRGIWYKDTGGGLTELWRGFLEPITFSGSYNWQPSLTLTFTDQLNNLQRSEYGRGSKFYSNKKLIKIIADALKDTDLELPIHVGINMYEDSHNSTASDDPLDQTFIDQEFFYDEESIGKSYETVLNELLKPFGAKLLQWQGAWWIIRIEELVGSFDYRVFDKDGDYSSNSSYNPLKELRRSCITDARATWVGGSQNLELLKQPKNIIVTSELDIRESLLENYTFEKVTNPVFWSLNLSGGATISSNIVELQGNNFYRFNVNRFGSRISDSYAEVYGNYQVYSPSSGYNSFTLKFDVSFDQIDKAVPFIPIKIQVKFDPDIGSTTYLKPRGTNEAGEDWYYLYATPQNNFQTLEVNFPGLVSNGVQTGTVYLRIYPFNLKSAEYGDTWTSGTLGTSPGTSFLDGLRAEVTNNRLRNGERRTVITNTGNSNYNRLFFYELREADGDTESSPDISLIEPDDFATSDMIWELKERLTVGKTHDNESDNWRNVICNNFMYIDNVKLQVTPQGNPLKEREIITVNISQNSDNYETELLVSDKPDDIDAGRSYDSFLKLSDNTYTQNWTRDGSSESQTIQKIYTKQILRQYGTTTFKLTGTISTNNEGTHLDITPLDSLVETQDDGKIYYINGITINDKALEYEVQLVHSKASTTFSAANGFCEIPDTGGGTDDGGGDGGQFNGDFNADFGGDFDTILN